jgi:hypothetical protein
MARRRKGPEQRSSSQCHFMIVRMLDWLYSRWHSLKQICDAKGAGLGAFQIFLAMAAASASPAAPEKAALTAKDVAAIDAALDRREFRRAGLDLQKLVNQQMQRFGGPHEEFEITRLMGRGTELQGDHHSAVAILKFAANEAATPADGLRILPDLGTALEGSGALGEARRVYVELVEAKAASANQARLGIARIALIENPGAVHQLLQPLLNSAASTDERWEATLIDARASGITGDSAAQKSGLQAAWALAPLVAQRHGAVQRTAIDMALTDSAHAMALYGLSLTDWPPAKGLARLRSQLPPCGRYGITDKDWIIVSVWRAPGTSNHANLEVLNASRPDVIAPFITRLRLPSQLSADDFSPGRDSHASSLSNRCVPGLCREFHAGRSNGRMAASTRPVSPLYRHIPRWRRCYTCAAGRIVEPQQPLWRKFHCLCR